MVGVAVFGGDSFSPRPFGQMEARAAAQPTGMLINYYNYYYYNYNIYISNNKIIIKFGLTRYYMSNLFYFLMF